MPFDDEKTRQVDVMDDEPATDAQSERTLMVNPAELLRSGRPAPRAPLAEAAPAGGGALPVLGGIGAFLYVPALVLMFLPLLQGSGDMRQWAPVVSNATTAIAFVLLALGLFGSIGRAGGFSVAAGIFAAIGAIGALLAFVPERDLALVVAFSAPAAWLFIGIWCLTALGATGKGLGIPTGICAMLGGLGLAGAYLILLGGLSRRGMNSDEFLGVFLASLCLLAVAGILLGLTFIIKVRKAELRG